VLAATLLSQVSAPDDPSIQACNERAAAMVCTGQRTFNH